MLCNAHFTRLDLHGLSPEALEIEAERAGLAHLAGFVASIERCQSRDPGSNVRAYLWDLVRQGWFEITCPDTGRMLRSGSSMILADKTVVFSFSERPSLLVGVGDISLGCPICGIVLADRQLFLGITATPWGFTERHLSTIADAMEATGWVPGPVSDSLQLVLGDPNFAHHSWNQLSALEDLSGKGLPDRDIRLIATHQPLGPIHELVPECALWPLSYRPDTALVSLNAPGALFAPVGGVLIRESLVQRVFAIAEAHISPEYQAIHNALNMEHGPVLWVSVRTRNRTATNQHAMLVALAQSFLTATRDGVVVIDGHSFQMDLASNPSYDREAAHRIAAHDREAAEAITHPPCSEAASLIRCRDAARRVGAAEQAGVDRIGSAAAAAGEDLAHLVPAAVDGPQGAARAGQAWRGQARA